MEIVLGWPTIPEHGFCPGVWYKYSLSLNWKKKNKKQPDFSPFPSSSYHLWIVCFAGNGTSCPFSSSVLGFLSGWSLCRSCECSHSLCELICASVVLFPDNTVSLKSSTTSGSYNLSVPSFTQIPAHWWEACEKDIPVRVELHKASHSLYAVQLWISGLITVNCKKRLCWGLSWSFSAEAL